MRLNLALTDDGIYGPDEVYQTLEPAHRLVFGYGWVAWEFQEGARSWALPGLVAALFRLAVALGLPEPGGYLVLTRLFFCGLSVATALAVALLARSLGASRSAAAVGAAVCALMGLSIYFAPRAMGETAGALPVTLAFALLLSPSHTIRRSALAAGLLVVATFLRLQDGVFCVAALGLLASQRRWREATWAGGVLATGSLAYGFLDALTWGSWFQSAITNVRYNVDHSSVYGVFPVWQYLTWLVKAEPWMVPILIGLASLGWRNSKPVLWILFAFVGLHSLIPHKELRFVLPALPLLCAAAAVGISRMETQWPRLAPISLAALTTLALASGVAMGWPSFGPIRNPAISVRPLDVGGPESRLLRVAGARTDICGLDIRSIEYWRTEGYTAFHNPAPLYGVDLRAPAAANYNYVIARRGEVAGSEVAVDGPAALVRVSNQCVPDAAYDYHLNLR